MNNNQLLPKISVIVPVYNGDRDLPDLLKCLENQTYPNNLAEYLIIDNNSSDRTREIILTASQEKPKINIQYIQENNIQSSYAARNKGIKAATGEILAFTDADCRPQNNWLENLIAPFHKQNIGIVAGEIIALPGNTILEKHAEKQNTLSQKHTLAHSFYPYGQTANLAIRRKILQEIGLFRPYLTTGGDADICWRIQQQTEWKLEFQAQAIVQHRHRSNLKELQKQWYRYGESNRYLHELYGVDMIRELKGREYLYLLGRWLIKEIPRMGIKAIAGKANLVDILNTPIDLIGVWSRAKGQRKTQLPEAAKAIEWE